MNPAIRRKIWDTQMFMQKGRELNLSNLETVRDFFRNEIFTDNYHVKGILPYEMCHIIPELTGSSDFESCKNNMGTYGFDAPPELIDYMIQHMADSHSDTDAIIIDGDFIAHGYTLNNPNATIEEQNNTWVELKKILTQDMDMLRTRFPGKTLLPTIGNNDVIIHNQMPCNEDEAMIYFKELF